MTDAVGETDEFSALVLVARDVEIFDLGTTAPNDAGPARALGISPRGAVSVSLGHPGETDQMPGRYEGGSVRPLDLPAGMVFGNTWAVNDSGQTVGPVYPAHVFGTVHAVMWNGSAPTMLGTLGGSSAIPVGLNANGWTVGWSYDSKSLPRGFLKRPGNPMVDVQEEAGVPARPAQDHEAGEDQRRRRRSRLLRLRACRRGVRGHGRLRRRHAHADDAPRPWLQRRRLGRLAGRAHGHGPRLRRRPRRPRGAVARRLS